MDNNFDDAIVAACVAGDTEQFALLYDKYIRKIYDFVYYKTNHRETAEDLVSQVFLKAIAKLSTYKSGQGTFQAWLYRIARNSVIDHYRTSHPAGNIDDCFDLADGSDAAADTDRALRLSAVRRELHRLTSEQRDILIMRVWQEMDYTEIAAMTGKSVDSAKMAYSRAVAKLKDVVPVSALAWLAFFG